MAEYSLTPEQIIKINRMKRLNLNPAYGGTLIMPEENFDDKPEAVVKAGGMEIKLTLAEAFRL